MIATHLGSAFTATLGRQPHRVPPCDAWMPSHAVANKQTHLPQIENIKSQGRPTMEAWSSPGSRIACHHVHISPFCNLTHRKSEGLMKGVLSQTAREIGGSLQVLGFLPRRYSLPSRRCRFLFKGGWYINVISKRISNAVIPPTTTTPAISESVAAPTGHEPLCST